VNHDHSRRVIHLGRFWWLELVPGRLNNSHTDGIQIP
jgi:hypothetical protein